MRSACQHVLVVGIVFCRFGLSSDAAASERGACELQLCLASGQSGRCPEIPLAGRPEGMGKKGNKSSNQVAEPQHRRKPWQLGSDWEVFPLEVPPYERWTPGFPIERLEVTLDGLRRGELWICRQLELLSTAVEADLRARDEMLRDHEKHIYNLQELLRSTGTTIALLVARDAQLNDMRDALEESNRALANQVADLQKQVARMSSQMNEMMQASWEMKRDLERQQLDTHGGLFREQLCDELVHLATTLRTPPSIRQRISDAQTKAYRRTLSEAGSVSCPSRPESPAPSLVGRGA